MIALTRKYIISLISYTNIAANHLRLTIEN
jgi:hypothetical protein